jgi:prolyl-tRNA synthetase
MTAKDRDKQKNLGVTPQTEDYSQWYTDVVQKAGLADYSPIKGMMVIRPYGYAIWENMQAALDQMFKETGHQNAYFPLFIPMSFLQREAEHVEGFAPELAVVTHGGGKELEEALAVRPTSETIINEMFSQWVQSYKDLPLLINQWCNVVRWEKRPRLFLRTTEFLWQEGHTAHATEDEAEAEARQMLAVYTRFASEYAGLSVVPGQKSDSERFAGAVRTYTIEALMGDRRALQSGTSHFLGQNFARAFNIQYRNRDNQLEYVWQTSWGLSTRMVGATVMAHGDDKGLILPPRLAPHQVVVIPITPKADSRQQIMEACGRIVGDLKRAGMRARLDAREDLSPGFKYNEWEMKGVPLRLELGPRDFAEQKVMGVRRDTGEKAPVHLTGLAENVAGLLETIQQGLLERNRRFREENTFEVKSLRELGEMFSSEGGAGFALCFHCGSRGCDESIKEKLGATNRCFPFNVPEEEGSCIVCGSKTLRRALVARAY